MTSDPKALIAAKFLDSFLREIVLDNRYPHARQDQARAGPYASSAAYAARRTTPAAEQTATLSAGPGTAETTTPTSRSGTPVPGASSSKPDYYSNNPLFECLVCSRAGEFESICEASCQVHGHGLQGRTQGRRAKCQGDNERHHVQSSERRGDAPIRQRSGRRQLCQAQERQEWHKARQQPARSQLGRQCPHEQTHQDQLAHPAPHRQPGDSHGRLESLVFVADLCTLGAEQLDCPHRLATKSEQYRFHCETALGSQVQRRDTQAFQRQGERSKQAQTSHRG
ncbi:hypothetical protein L1887_54121 [Cichorium endivia]|nr:hypothetical protein L1887_54121 [Cichorium endivia]